MPPELPQNASPPDRDARRAALDRARERYRYSYTYPPGAAWADEVPKGEGYTIPYLADFVKVEATLKANHVAARLGGLEEFDEATHHHETSTLTPADVGDRLFRIGPEIAADMQRTRFETVADFRRFFGIIAEPPMMPLYTGTPTEQDRLFAWQRIAGANPLVLQGVERLGDHFPVTEAHFSAAIADESDSLEAALAEGRAFVADYAHMDGLQSGAHGELKKYLYAPIALFVRPKDRSSDLTAVAIQCGQRPSEAFPVLTPKDGYRWRMACAIVQMADGNDHETVQHLGRTHGVMEAVILALYRNVPPQHPLHVLLTPHFEHTLALNDSAKHSLIAPGGGVDHVLAGTLEASVTLTGQGLTTFRLDQAAPTKALAARNVMDRDALPRFPYRDDALDVYAATLDFVREYVDLYYTEEASVGADHELAAFLSDLGAEDGGRLGGVPEINDRATLAETLATIIFIASAQHSALNYAQFPFMGMIPNLPGAAYAPPPTADTPDEEASLVALLPPVDVATEHFTLAYQLSAFRRNHLGKYPLLHFKHRAASKIADGFGRKLEDLELLIGTRDGARFLSYPFLKPSMIAASIHI